MKCEEFQLLFEDYVDGALDLKKSALVTSHLAVCAECTGVLEYLSREQEVYARYQRDVEATPLLWSSIEARIKIERANKPAGAISRLRESLAGMFSAPRLSPAFAAAMVVIAIGITVAVMSYMNRSVSRTQVTEIGKTPVEERGGNDDAATSSQPTFTDPDKSHQLTASGPGSAQPGVRPKGGEKPVQRPQVAAKATPEQLVREAEQKYLTAIAMLSRDVNSQRSQLDPIVLARFDASLMEIDRTIKETKRIVRENPGDPIALQYLLAAYSKKVDVLREMTNN